MAKAKTESANRYPTANYNSEDERKLYDSVLKHPPNKLIPKPKSNLLNIQRQSFKFHSNDINIISNAEIDISEVNNNKIKSSSTIKPIRILSRYKHKEGIQDNNHSIQKYIGNKLPQIILTIGCNKFNHGVLFLNVNSLRIFHMLQDDMSFSEMNIWIRIKKIQRNLCVFDIKTGNITNEVYKYIENFNCKLGTNRISLTELLFEENEIIGNAFVVFSKIPIIDQKDCKYCNYNIINIQHELQMINTQIIHHQQVLKFCNQKKITLQTQKNLLHKHLNQIQDLIQNNNDLHNITKENISFLFNKKLEIKDLMDDKHY